MKKRILVVEDDLTLSKVLRDNLQIEGFEVRSETNGATALTAAEEFAPDLILLDAMLPGKNGFDLCRAWRRTHDVPIIMLTALGQKADKLRGLALGADDYVTKPFDLDELIARIRALLRRSSPKIDRIFLGNLMIDFTNVRAVRDGQDVDLTYREFELLQYLAERARVVRRDELLTAVWHYREDIQTRAVDHAVARLRQKIEPDPHHPLFIHTVHGDGYMLSFDTVKTSEAS